MVTADLPAATPRAWARRLPVRVALVLSKAERVFAGLAQDGPVDLLRSPATHIADDELKGSPNGGVGAVALAKALPPEFMPIRRVTGPFAMIIGPRERQRAQAGHAWRIPAPARFNRAEQQGHSTRADSPP